MNGFKAFVLRGNVVDLAVGVVIGAAFTAIVTSVVSNLIDPLIGLFGTGNFSRYALHLGRTHVFGYGRVITSLISFLITAAVVYFGVVRPVNALLERYKTEPEVESTTVQCPECLSAIPVGARRCAFCTAEQAAVGGAGVADLGTATTGAGLPASTANPVAGARGR